MLYITSIGDVLRLLKTLGKFVSYHGFNLYKRTWTSSEEQCYLRHAGYYLPDLSPEKTDVNHMVTLPTSTSCPQGVDNKY